METIHTLHELKERVANSRRMLRIAAVMPDDEASQAALKRIADERLATVINIVNEQPDVAAQEAVALIRQGEADVLMKGLIGTDQLLRAVLNKETGILPQGHVLTHLAAVEIPTYHKLLFFSDAAVIPYPTHEQRIEQVRYAVNVCHGLGIDEPRVALTHCAEHGGKQFPFVDGYADIIQMAHDGAFGRCLVDGPMDIKTACSLEALHAKHMTSPLEGEADVLIMPDIEAGNTLYKALTFFVESKAAGMLCGAQCPVVLPSRGDDAETKYSSILLALGSLL